MEPKVNENKETFQKWFSCYKQERDQQNDYWDLAKSSSPELKEIVMKFEQSMHIIDGRIKSGKTYGLVFDGKKYRHPATMDALIKYRICDELSSGEEYYMKPDPSVKMTKLVKMNNKSNQVSKVLVPSHNWLLQDNARLNISSQDYCTYISNSVKRGHFVDLIILTLNSKKEFENVDIKLLLNEIKGKYNLVIFLNDAPKKECTFWKECDDCYEDIRESLSEMEVPTDERFIKISAKTILGNRIPRTPTDISFERAIKLLKDQLTMDNIIGRYLKDAQLFMNNFDEVKKSVLAIKSKVTNDASKCEKMLQAKKIETQKTINDSKNATEVLLEKELKTKTENMKNIDLKFVKEKVDPVIDKSFDEFREKFKKQIKAMIKTENPNLEAYITKMYFKQYKEESFEINLKKTIEKCLEEVLLETKNSDSKGKSVLEKFLEKTNGHVAKTFGKITSSFENFRDNLKEKVVDKFEKFEKTLDAITEEYTECLKKDLYDKLHGLLPTIEDKVTEIERSIDDTFSRVTKVIVNEILKQKDQDISSKYITNFFDLPKLVMTISNFIETIMVDLKNKIVTMISNIGSDPQTKKWINSIVDLINIRVFDRLIIEKHKRAFEEAFNKLDLTKDDLYTDTISPRTVAKSLQEIIFPNKETLSAKENEELEMETMNFLTIRRNSKVQYKYIKEDLMIEELKKIETFLKAEFHLTMHNMSTTLKTCMASKSWQL